MNDDNGSTDVHTHVVVFWQRRVRHGTVHRVCGATMWRRKRGEGSVYSEVALAFLVAEVFSLESKGG